MICTKSHFLEPNESAILQHCDKTVLASTEKHYFSFQNNDTTLDYFWTRLSFIYVFHLRYFLETKTLP